MLPLLFVFVCCNSFGDDDFGDVGYDDGEASGRKRPKKSMPEHRGKKKMRQ